METLQIQKMSQKNSKIVEFIVKKIKETQKTSLEISDEMQRLKLAASEVSYAHLLSQYMQNNLYVFDSLIHLAEAYIRSECYEEAIIQARLAKKQGMGVNGSKEKAMLLISECMIKQNRYEDAYETLINLENVPIFQDCQVKYYDLLMNVCVQLGQQSKAKEVESKFQQLILAKYGESNIQYGFFLIKKGKSLGKFAKHQEALENLRKGMDILIELKCRNKKQITAIYLLMADYQKKLNNLEKQYSCLICAHAMARQLEDPQKSTLPILHTLANNLIERQQYQEALKELKKAKEVEKQIYGESSVQIAKTTKKISEMLTLLNMKGEARKCEQQYSRIISSSPVKALLDKSNHEN